MTIKGLGMAAIVLSIQAAMLLTVGAAMWSEAPTAADEAVGKGLMAVGSTVVVPVFVICCAVLNMWEPFAHDQSQGTND